LRNVRNVRKVRLMSNAAAAATRRWHHHVDFLVNEWMPCSTHTTDATWAADAKYRRADTFVEVASLDEAKAEAARRNAALPPRPAPAPTKRARIPSERSCRAAGTHMIRCTGDGHCKVCFR